MFVIAFIKKKKRMNTTNTTAVATPSWTSWLYTDKTPFNIISLSDFTAAITGYVFAEVIGHTSGYKQATQSFFVSLVARAITEGGWIPMFSSLNNSQKNEILVGVLSAAAAKMKNKSVSKGVIMGVSIDLVAEDIIRMLGLSDVNLLTYGFNGLGGSNPIKVMP